MALLEQSPERGIEKIYVELRNEFLAFTNNICTDRPWQLDAYHQGVISFYELYCSGRYDAKRASIKTLVFGMGKNRLLTRLKQEGKINHIDQWIDVPETSRDVDTTEMVQQMTKAMKNLGEKCQRIIELFYYHRYSIHAIQVEMKYLNENTVKAHKSRCLKRLKDQINNR